MAENTPLDEKKTDAVEDFLTVPKREFTPKQKLCHFLSLAFSLPTFGYAAYYLSYGGHQWLGYVIAMIAIGGGMLIWSLADAK